jgi:hypothetical protein
LCFFRGKKRAGKSNGRVRAGKWLALNTAPLLLKRRLRCAFPAHQLINPFQGRAVELLGSAAWVRLLQPEVEVPCTLRLRSATIDTVRNASGALMRRFEHGACVLPAATAATSDRARRLLSLVTSSQGHESASERPTMKLPVTTTAAHPGRRGGGDAWTSPRRARLLRPSRPSPPAPLRHMMLLAGGFFWFRFIDSLSNTSHYHLSPHIRPE